MCNNIIRTLTVLSLCVVVGFYVTGCGREDTTDGKKRQTIAVIPKGMIHEFWKTVHAGAEKAGQELDVDILWKGSLKEDDREAQISVVENIDKPEIRDLINPDLSKWLK